MNSRTFRLASLIVLTALIPVGSRGQSKESKPALLVSTSWLAQHANDRNVVLLHVGDRKGYDAEHIPGARYISSTDISAPMDHERGGLMLQMPPVDSLRSHLAALGISDNSRIIVYFANDWVTPST